MRRYVGDTALSVGRGAVQGVRMLTDIAGADNAVSGGLRSVEDFIGGLQSATAKRDQAEIARLLAEAEGKGVLDQVVAGLKAFGTAPLQTMAQAAGTSLPTIAAALIPGAGQVAMAARFAAPLAMGAAQGAGAVKSSIYDEVKQRALKEGRTPAEAEQLAAQAQSYGGENAGQIALGAGLGAWAGKSGLEGAAQRLVHGSGGQAASGMASRVAMGALAEGIPEAAQGGQEKFASNSALNNAGFPTDPMSGVIANATMEGLAGHAMGGAMGIPRPGDAIRETMLPEGGPMTRAANAATKAQARAADAGMAPLKFTPTELPAGESGELKLSDKPDDTALDFEADPRFAGAKTFDNGAAPNQPMFASKSLADIHIGEQGAMGELEAVEAAPGQWTVKQTDEAANRLARANIEQWMAKAQPMPEERARSMAKDADSQLGKKMTALPMPDGSGWTVVPTQWVSAPILMDYVEHAAAAEQANAEREARAKEAGESAVVRAPRTPSANAVEIDPKAPNAVAQFIAAQAATNTMSARAFVQDYRAGRITDADVLERINPKKASEPSADERIAAAAAQAPKPAPTDGLILNPNGEPFKTELAANRAQKKAGTGAVLQVAGGWVVRPGATTVEPSNAQDQATSVPPAAAPAPVQEGADSAGPGTPAAPAAGAAGPTGAAAPAVEGAGLKEQPSPVTEAIQRAKRRLRDVRSKLATTGVRQEVQSLKDQEASIEREIRDLRSRAFDDEAPTPDGQAAPAQKKPPFVSKEDGEHLFGIPQKRAKGGQSAAPENAIDRRNRLKAERAAPQVESVTTPEPAAASQPEPEKQAGAQAQASQPNPAAPSANTLVTEDAAEKARAIIRAKLRGNTLNSGIDPELLQAGITLAAYHVERGARKFAAYARAMVDDMGDSIKPYLQSWYMAMRSDPTYAAMRADMDKASAVEDLDVDEVLAGGAAATPNAPAPVEAPAAEAVVPGATSGSVETDGVKPTLTMKPNGDGQYMLTATDATGKRLGQAGFTVKEIGGKRYLSIDDISVKEQGRGVGSAMYEYAINNLPPGIDGVLSESGWRKNKQQVPAIHKKLAAKFNAVEIAEGTVFSPRAATPNAEAPVQAAPRGAEAAPVAPAPAERTPKAQAVKEALAGRKADATALADAWTAMTPEARASSLQAADVDLNTPTGRASVEAKRLAAMPWQSLPDALRAKLAPIVALRVPKDAQPAAAATHKDPGEPAEPVTPAVVQEAIKTGVQATDRKPSAMKAELLAKIDEAVKDAPDYMDFQAVVKTMGLKDATAAYTSVIGRASLGDKAAPQGYSRPTLRFKIEGDGVFTVNNTVRQLLTFRAKVEASPGFRDRQAPAGLNERATDTLDRRSADAAIANMIEEGDFQAALDYAQAKGVDMANVKLTKVLRDRLDKWEQDQASAKRMAEYEAANPPAPKPEPAPAPAAEPEADDTPEAGIASQTFEQWAKAQYAGNEYKAKYLEEFNGDEKRAILGAAAGTIDNDQTTAVLLKTAKQEYRSELFKLPRETSISLDVWDDLSDMLKVEAQRHFFDLDRRITRRDQDTYAAKAKAEREKKAPYEAAFAEVDAEIRRLDKIPGPETQKQKDLSGRRDRLREAIYQIGQGKEPDGRLLRKEEDPAAPAAASAMTGPRRDPEKVSMFNPYLSGDIVTIGGKDWMLKQDMPGWYLTSDGTWRGEHPTIRGIKAMQDLIREVEQAAQDAAPAVAPAAPAEQAAAILNAAAEPPNGRERLDVLKDVKAGAITPEEVAAAFPPAPITDVGEKIGGARKDMAESGGTRSKRGTTDDRPAWARRFEISQIVTPGGMVGEVKDAGRWIIRDARNLDWMKQPRQVGRSTYATKEEAEAQVPLAAVALKHRVVLARSAAPKTEADVDATLKADMAAKAADDERPGKIEYGLMQTARKRLAAGSMTQANFNILQEKYGAAAAQYTPPAEPAVKAPTGEKYEIWRDITDRKRVKVVDQQFDSREEAMAYMMANAVQIVEANTTFGEADLPLPPDRARTGPERRTGNVTADDFKATFGFRGVQFGNWNNQDERQALMNDAWDGLMDLADVLGLPPKALGLNGDLALAFGARGHGLNSARAHYEPARTVINLTKEQGAGSLAHEWFHALDHYFGRQDGKASATWKVGQDGTRTLDVSGDGAEMVSSGFRGERSGVRKGLRNAYDAMLRTMTKKAETYVEDTAKADKWTGVAREELAQALASLRRELAEQKDVRYYKRNNKPASAELLAEFDAIAKQMLDGEVSVLATDWKTFVKGGDKPANARGASIATRWTNDSLERLSAIHKEVRGRSGFDGTNKQGVLDRLRGNMERYSQRLKMLADAQGEVGKVRAVPTDFAMNARDLDQGRGTDYWTTPHEMAARAFQGYVEDKIAERGGMSRFLNYAPENAAILTPWGFKRPYPAGEERKAINDALDKFISALETRADDAGNVAMFSRAEAQQQPASDRRQAVEALVQQIASRWNNAPEVVVVDSLEDERVPKAVRDYEKAQQSKGASGAPEGFFFGGKVYLVAGQLGGDADVLRVLFHESLGHFGLRGTFGPELGAILDRLAVLNAAKVRAKAKQYGLDYDKPSDRRAAAEEVLAEMAQRTPDIGWGKKAIAAIRTWLRLHVPGFRKMAMSDAELVRSYILPARAFVQRGGPNGGPGGGVTFSRANQTQAPAFRKWFGDSKVVDADGKPLVVYHGTSADIKAFDDSFAGSTMFSSSGMDGHFFTADPDTAAAYAKVAQKTQHEKFGRFYASQNVMPVYLALKNPMVYERRRGDAASLMDTLKRYETNLAKENGYDGIIFKGFRDTPTGRGKVADTYVAFSPNQIKSATGNSGAFDPGNPDIRFSRSIGDAVRDFSQQGARNAFMDAVTSHGSTNLWTRTVGTQYHKAKTNPTTFGPVFNAVQDYIKETSVFANQAADLAPSLLPKLDSWRDLVKDGIARHGADPVDTAKAGEAIFRGTLDKTLYSEEALASRFGLTPKQIALYREFRLAVDKSLDGLAKSEILRLAGDEGLPVRNAVLAAQSAGDAAELLNGHLTEMAEETGRDDLLGTVAKIRLKAQRIEQLKDEGYAPLTRFGKHTLTITEREGGVAYFGMYESVREANKAARLLGEDPEFSGMTFTQGIMSQEGHKLFAGLSLDALELFADATDNADNPVYQDYLKLALANRSAMKRMIERKGTKGYSDDVARVLASFVTSNARAAAGNLHLTDAKKAAEAIPKEQGDLRDDAINLVEYVTNPAEEAAAVRGLLFTTFIGGSVASALVNITQPITMTLPYLTQFGGAGKAAKRLLAAAAMVATGKVTGDMAAALRRAEADGIVSPQEIHHLQAEAMNSMGQNPYLKKAAFMWGSLFSLAEQFNRRVSFVAAYQTATEQGIANPFAFAEQAVVETQGLYNKGNKANLARGAVGATVMTFKQFATHYLEFLTRMAKNGPEGRKAVAVALAILLLTAGAGGLPFADDLDDLIDTLGQAMGHDTNSKRWKRQFIAQTLGLGDTAAEVSTRGLSALPGMPIDLSLRMGMGNLLPATGLMLRSNTDTARQLLEVAGAAGGLAASIKDGAAKALGGDVVGGTMTAMPVAIQNIAKAVQMWDTGEYRDKKGRKVMDVDAMDGAAKFLGFQPAAVARESSRAGETMRTVQLAKNVEAEIAGKWAQAMADGDKEAVADARQELADWNAANPQAPIKITLPQVLRRLKELKTSRADRATKAAPKELRPLVREVLH